MKFPQKQRQNILKNSIVPLVIFLSLALIPFIWIITSDSTDSIISKLSIVLSNNRTKWKIMCDTLEKYNNYFEMTNWTNDAHWVIHTYKPPYKDYHYYTKEGNDSLIGLRAFMDSLYPSSTDGFTSIFKNDALCYIRIRTTIQDIHHNRISIIYSKVSTDSIKRVFPAYDFCDSINPPKTIGKWLYKLEDNWYIYSP